MNFTLSSGKPVSNLLSCGAIEKYHLVILTNFYTHHKIHVFHVYN
jgi:hypothetical protein